MSAPEARSQWGAVALVALLIVSLALGVLVLRARTPDLALEVTSFPKELDDRGLGEFEFFVRFDEPEATVEIVGRDEVVARTLARSVPLASEERILCSWNGLEDDGDRVDPGRYRLRVTLPGRDRVMVYPRRLDVQPGAQEESPPPFREPCAAEAEG